MVAKSMEFGLSQEQRLMQSTIEDIGEDYGLEYWREKDQDEEFPHEVWETLSEAGFAGTIIPQEYGGQGYGMLELVLLSMALARSGGGVSGANLLTSGVIAPTAIRDHGTEAQKERWLPEMADGAFISIALTEPNAGLDTAGIEMRAEEDGNGFVLNGTKTWITGATQSEYLITLARTAPKSEGARHEGISLFLVPSEAAGLEMNKIDKLSMRCLGSYEVVYDDVHVSADSLIGDRGKGFFHVLNSLNTERLNWAAIPLGAGELALSLAVDYANERESFGKKIGANQGVQFPLAECKAELETAKLMLYKAAWLHDNGKDCAMEANASKLMGARAGFNAADQALQTHGGMGFADEYHVERLYRDIRLAKVAPVSDELVKAYIGEHVLDLPPSY